MTLKSDRFNRLSNKESSLITLREQIQRIYTQETGGEDAARWGKTDKEIMTAKRTTKTVKQIRTGTDKRQLNKRFTSN